MRTCQAQTGPPHPSLICWLLYRTTCFKEDTMKAFIDKHKKDIIGGTERLEPYRFSRDISLGRQFGGHAPVSVVSGNPHEGRQTIRPKRRS